MTARSDRTFVYGEFKYRGTRAGLPPPPGYYGYAIQILREFSPTEFIGRLYVRKITGDREWVPVSPDALPDYEWHNRVTKQKSPKRLYFKMAGEGYWEVLNYRGESDEPGFYVAIALKYDPTPPEWVRIVK